MNITHIGDAKTSCLHLPDTYLVPKLTYNLISVGQLCDLGLTILFSPSGCQVQDPQTRKILGRGKKVGRLFELTSLCLPSNQVSAVVTSTTSIHQWHLRLGHASASKLQTLVSHGLLCYTKFEPFNCLHCKLAV